jgi:hypothetical protein
LGDEKKSNGTLCGQLNTRGFKQVEGQHYNGMTISSPVTNSAKIRIVLVLMVMASMMAHIGDVKGAFLHGEFKDGEKVHMAIPCGFKKHFPVDCVILMLKCLYGLKQAARAIWRQLLRAAKKMGLMCSSADPCLYYKWSNGRLVMVLSWIDDNAIVGCKKYVLNLKQDLMKHSTVTIVERWKNMSDAQSRSLSQEGLSSYRRCWYKASTMSLTSKA